MYKLVINKEDATGALKELLQDSQESLNRDEIRVALKGEMHTQSEADQILSDYVADKEALDADHELTIKLEKVVEDAMAIGNSIIKRYGAKNIKALKTDAEIDQILIDMASIMNALVSGSLKSARRQALAFTPTAEVPQVDIDWFVAELNKILGV